MTYKLTLISKYTGEEQYQTYDNEADALLVAELNDDWHVIIEEVQ